MLCVAIFGGQNTGHLGTNIESTRCWNAEGAERARVVWEFAPSEIFLKICAVKCSYSMFEAVSGIHF